MRIHSHWRHDRIFWLILGLAEALALAYNFAILIGYAPDEHQHMSYVVLLLDEHRLPFFLPDGSEYHGAHAYHPPFYYCCLVPFYAIFRVLPEATAWHLTRAVSGLFCLASLPLLYEVALTASKNRNVARIATGTVAFTPIFGMTAGIINNDAAALFFTSLFFYLLTVRFAERRDVKSALVLGVVLGVGGLCKLTVLFCGSAALLVALWSRHDLKIPLAWKMTLMTFFVGALIVSPWHIRSFLLNGTLTPMPPAAPWFNPPISGLTLLAHPDFPALLVKCSTSLFITMWSQRDWLLQRQTEPIGAYEGAQTFIYCVLATFSLTAVCGHLKALRKQLPSALRTVRLKT